MLRSQWSVPYGLTLRLIFNFVITIHDFQIGFLVAKEISPRLSAMWLYNISKVCWSKEIIVIYLITSIDSRYPRWMFAKKNNYLPSIHRFSAFVSNSALINPIADMINRRKPSIITVPHLRCIKRPRPLRKDCSKERTTKAGLFPFAWPCWKNIHIYNHCIC